MRHGWRALAPAVGPAQTELPRVAAPTPESPLLLCPEGQSLPTAGTVGDTQCRTGGGHDMKPHLNQLRIMTIMSIASWSEPATGLPHRLIQPTQVRKRPLQPKPLQRLLPLGLRLHAWINSRPRHRTATTGLRHRAPLRGRRTRAPGCSQHGRIRHRRELDAPIHALAGRTRRCQIADLAIGADASIQRSGRRQARAQAQQQQQSFHGRLQTNGMPSPCASPVAKAVGERRIGASATRQPEI